MIDREYEFYKEMAEELIREHAGVINFLSGFGPKRECDCRFCTTFREYNYIGDYSNVREEV